MIKILLLKKLTILQNYLTTNKSFPALLSQIFESANQNRSFTINHYFGTLWIVPASLDCSRFGKRCIFLILGKPPLRGMRGSRQRSASGLVLFRNQNNPIVIYTIQIQSMPSRYNCHNPNTIDIFQLQSTQLFLAQLFGTKGGGSIDNTNPAIT